LLCDWQPRSPFYKEGSCISNKSSAIRERFKLSICGYRFWVRRNVDGILVAVQSNGLAYRLLGIKNVEI
jgi:hypothetical protein